MKFPVIVFEKNDKKMFALDDHYLMGDLRLVDNILKDVQIIDSDGIIYPVKRVFKDSSIKIWQSIINIGFMVKLKPIIEESLTKISLEDLKIRIINHVEKNPKFWSPIDTVSGIKEMVKSAQGFEELIRIFK